MQCYDFKYLGSTISNNASQDNELRYRMAIASVAFGKPQDRFWKNRHVMMMMMMMMIHFISVSGLLAGHVRPTNRGHQIKILPALTN